jgi:hypothetical protein
MQGSDSAADERARLAVIDQADRSRYELVLDGTVVGYAPYSVDGDVMTLPHIETAAPHRGKNFAARLMGGIVDDARYRSLHIRPLCGYADAYLQRQPDTDDLRI